jgi:hypothetical protein
MNNPTTSRPSHDHIATTLGYDLLRDIAIDVYQASRRNADLDNHWSDVADNLRVAVTVANALDYVDRVCTTDAERARVLVWNLAQLPPNYTPAWHQYMAV